MNRARRVVIGAALGACAWPVVIAHASEPAKRVLFIGNSYTYYNDLPAVFAQVAGATLGTAVHADMLARGGASLAEQLAYGALPRILDETDFDTLVLQEVAGLLTCPPRLLDACAAAKVAHGELAELARKRGMRGVMLGTFRQRRAGAEELSRQEQRLAQRCGLLRVDMSDSDQLLAAEPGLQWLDADGAHPGPDWTLLAALRLCSALYGKLPQAAPMRLDYRDYRGTRSPSYDRLASALDVGAAAVRRELTADEFAARLKLARPRD